MTGAWDELGYRLPCSYCNARPGGSCVTSSGRRAAHLHDERVRDLRQLWRVGYRAGLREALGGIYHRLKLARVLSPQVTTELVRWAVAWKLPVDRLEP